MTAPDVRATITGTDSGYQVCLVVGPRIVTRRVALSVWGARRLAKRLLWEWRHGNGFNYREVVR